MTKAEFIRSQPLTMGPSEVVEVAKKAGYKVDSTYVSKVRPMGGAKKKASAKNASAPSAKSSPHMITDHGEEAMIRFLELAKALGKDKARRLVELL